MKKVMVFLTAVVTMVMILATAGANQDPIWDNVWEDWKEQNKNEYEMFIQTEYDSNGFIRDGIAYFAGSNCSLWYDETHTLSEIKEYFDKASSDAGITDFQTEVTCLGSDQGRYIIELKLRTEHDLTKIEGANCDFPEPVYGLTMVCYDRITIPE